jgi:hypothetical protein
MNNRQLSVVLCSIFLAVMPAQSAVNDIISVQLANTNAAIGGYQPLAPTESTGFLPATNWNFLAVYTPFSDDYGNYDPRGNFGRTSNQTFVVEDQEGNTGVTLQILGAADAWRHENPNTNTTAISKLMNTFIKTWFRDESGFNTLGDGLLQLEFSGLDNATTYNAYVYLADMHGDGTGGYEADIYAGNGATNYTGSLPMSLPDTFIASANQDPNGTRDSGNYVHLTGITPTNNAITITVEYYDPSWTGWGAGVCGVQLVNATADTVPPAIPTNPTDKTVYTNVTATYSTTVSGTPTPSIQWYEIDGGLTNPVSGATDLSYTTPPATLAMNGTAYFAVASNSVGIAVSESATLTVMTPAADAGEVYSVQLGDPDVGGYVPLEPDEITGAYPITNWNPVFVDVPGAGVGWLEQTFELNDQYGAQSGVDLIVRGASDAWRYNDPLANTEPRNKLMNSFIKSSFRPDQFLPNEVGEGKMELILTNLNDAVSYSVYIYLADNDGYEANVDAGTAVTNYTGTLPSTLPAAFVASTNQNPFGTRDPGNYVRQSGLSPINGMIKITVNYFDPDWVGFGVGVCGLQLVIESRDVFGPILDPQPANERVLTNTTATVIAGALGWPTADIQWYEIAGGVTSLISGATSQSYTTPPVTDATSGQGYFMTASSGLGTASSEVAYVTGAHLVSPATGVLQVDQYYVTNSTLADVLDPFWLVANTPSNTYWIDNFENISELPDNTTERIYGFFTPPVTTNYVFFISADDDALLLLSTDDDPANVCQIAHEEIWSESATSWTNSGGGSTLSQKRSDQFSPTSVTSDPDWPTGNTISLTAGESYYIEVGHRQGGGGQSAAVTYTFSGDPDPVDGTSTVIASGQISTFSSTENLQNEPVPHIASSVSSSDLVIFCSNGRVNGMYDVLWSDDLRTPLGSWTVEATGFFDASGNFETIITTGSPEPVRFYRVLSLD